MHPARRKDPARGRRGPALVGPAMRISLLALAGLLVSCPATLLASGDRDGAAIYKAMCVRCHGEKGEGTDEYPRALAGDRSTAQLSKLIAKTMPEDEPGTCTGPDADAVASYIHDAFYSAIARARNQPARIELSRLT